MAYGNHGYRNSEAGSLAPRDIEAAAFLFVNRSLEQAHDQRTTLEALCRNQKLWSLLLKDLACSTNALPEVLKQDLVRLGTWAMAYSIRAMQGGVSLAPLVDINRDIVEALRGSTTAPDAAPSVAAARPSIASFAAAV